MNERQWRETAGHTAPNSYSPTAPFWANNKQLIVGKQPTVFTETPALSYSSRSKSVLLTFPGKTWKLWRCFSSAPQDSERRDILTLYNHKVQHISLKFHLTNEKWKESNLSGITFTTMHVATVGGKTPVSSPLVLQVVWNLTSLSILSSDRLDEEHLCTSVFKSCHRFSVECRPRLWLGHSNTWCGCLRDGELWPQSQLFCWFSSRI